MATIDLTPYINWTQIAQLPTPVPGPLPVGYPTNNQLLINPQGFGAMNAYVCDDNSFIVLTTTPQANWGAIPDCFPFVVDASGAFTSYVVPDVGCGYIAHVDSHIGGILTMTDNPFCRVGNNTVFVQALFTNAKLNNPVPIRLPNAVSNLVGPCGERGAPKIFYDSSKGVVAYGYYGSQGQFGGSISAATYAVDKFGNQALLTNGPAGVWNSSIGQDDFDHTGLFTSGVTALMNNGLRISGDGMQVGFVNINVLLGTTVGCGAGNNSLIRATSNGGQFFPYVFDGGPGFTNPLLVDTSLPGLSSVITTTQSSLQAYAPGFSAVAYNAAAPIGGRWDRVRVVITRKYMFAVSTINVGNTLPVYRTATPAPLLTLPGFGYRQSHFSANFARPISLTGRYKA